MKKLLTLLACFALLLSCNSLKKDKSNCAVTESQITPRTGHDFEIDGIYYKVVNDTSNEVKVTYKGNDCKDYRHEYSGVVVIPNKLTYDGKNYTVTEIDNYAFSGCSKITSISIPNSVWNIGFCAFSGCEGLKEIHISDLAAWCELSFDDLLDYVGDSPFHYATELYLNGELVTDIVVPENATHIGAHTFEGYEKLRSVVLHKGIEAIYKSAFYGCTNLTSVNIPEDAYYIGPYAFDDTSWYENVPEGEVYTGKHLYKYKGDMPDNTSIVIKEGTVAICESAFDGCKGLTRITIPSSIRCIHDYTFCGCNNLKEIYCKGQTPPYLNNFYSEYHDDVVLYVPKGAKEIYKNSDNMGYFENIKEIDFDN